MSLLIVGNTMANLKTAIAGDTNEYENMYPPMLSTKEEWHKAKVMFGFAVKAKEVHTKFFAMVLESVKKEHDLDYGEIYLCPVCGPIEFSKLAEKCPVCNSPESKFVTI